MENSALTSEHIRAARMLLRWEQKDLARRSGVSLPSIKRLESQPGTLSAYEKTIAAIRKTFEDQGVEFINGDTPGVWLRKGDKAGAGTVKQGDTSMSKSTKTHRAKAGTVSARPKPGPRMPFPPAKTGKTPSKQKTGRY